MTPPARTASKKQTRERGHVTEQEREPGKYLNTLAFRCTPALVGTAGVSVRHFDEATWKLWDDFDRQCKQRYNNESAQAPYSIATTVLSMMSGGYVCFAPDRQAPFLASLHPIDSKLLLRVFTLTHGLALGQGIGTIDLTAPPELARRIAGTPEGRHLLADFLEADGNTQATAPNWLYRTVAWELSRRLAREPWAISDSRTIRLRPDSTRRPGRVRRPLGERAGRPLRPLTDRADPQDPAQHQRPRAAAGLPGDPDLLLAGLLIHGPGGAARRRPAPTGGRPQRLQRCPYRQPPCAPGPRPPRDGLLHPADHRPALEAGAEAACRREGDEETSRLPPGAPWAGLACPAEELLLPHRHRPWHAPPEASAPALHQGLRRPGRAPGDARGGNEPAAPPHRPGEHLQGGVPAPEGGERSPEGRTQAESRAGEARPDQAAG